MAAQVVREDGMGTDTVAGGRETYGKNIGRQSVTKKRIRREEEEVREQHDGRICES